MNATLIATIAGLVTAMCWGTSDWCSARSTKKLNPLQINFAVQAASIIVVAGLFLFSGVHLDNSGQLVRIATSGLLITTGYLIFVRALSSGVVGIVVPLGNMYPLFTLLLSIIFLKAHFSALQLSAMVGIVLGASLLAYEKNHKAIPLKELHKDTFLALIAAITWGVAYFIVNPVVKEVSWQTITIVSELFSAALALLLVLTTSRTNTLMTFKASLSSKTALAAGLAGTVGFLAFYFGSGRVGNLVIPAVLSAGAPLVASTWGAVFDHEKIGMTKRAGAVVMVAGIMLLNLA